jgi:hypothetical protein
LPLGIVVGGIRMLVVLRQLDPGAVGVAVMKPEVGFEHVLCFHLELQRLGFGFTLSTES